MMKTNDLINRADIVYHKQLEPMGNGQYEEVYVAYADDIDNMPSFTLHPEGEWEERYIEDDDCVWTRRRFYCSVCGNWNTYGKTDYCPKCGAKMKRREP